MGIPTTLTGLILTQKNALSTFVDEWNASLLGEATFADSKRLCSLTTEPEFLHRASTYTYVHRTSPLKSLACYLEPQGY